MRTGSLDTLVTPQTSTKTWADGEPTEAWIDGGSFWASVQEATARETIRAGQVDARQPVVVMARYLDAAGVSPTSRLVLDDGRVLDVQSTREIGRRQWVEILCVLNSDGGA